MSMDDDDHFTFNFDNLGPPDGLNDPNDIPLDVWVPDRAIEAINMEAQLHPDETSEQLAQRILKENLAVIAMGITHTAKYSSDSRLRFQAQTYVMDRVMGKIGSAVPLSSTPTQSLIDDLMKQVEEFANAGTSTEE